jgi:hypothetical protein
MRAQRLFPIALSVVLSILMMACKDDPVSPTTDITALKGTWIMETADGQSVIDDGTIWSFADGTSTFTDAKSGCRTTMTYTASGNKIVTTLTANSCGQDPVGTRDTLTWSVANGKLTLKDDESTFVLHKISGNERVFGSWEVSSIDGQPLAEGAAMALFLYGSRFEIVKIKPGEQPCMTSFDFANTGSALNVEVVGEECGDVEVGATDTFNWTVSGNTITLALAGGGLTIKGERM